MATETKATHTPAPWTLETVATSIGVCHKVGPLGSTTKLKSACLYDDCYSDKPRDLQLLADARLIAAAPELLAELKKVTAELNDAWGSASRNDYAVSAEQLIARVEGK